MSSQATNLPEGPHGVAPTENLPHGVVAQQDKSYTTRIAETAQPVVDAAQPLIHAAAEAISSVAAAGQAAVISGANAIGITGEKSTGPHGVPPSDALPHGVVAQQDKSYSTRIAETVNPVVQPVVTPVVNAAKPVIAGATNVANTVVQTGADTISSGVKAVGLGHQDPNARPEGPHGVAPTDNLPHGVVAQEDKSITTRVAEAAQPVVTPVVNAAQPVVNTASNVANTVVQTGANTISSGVKAVGLGPQDPNARPEGPHGVAPSDALPHGVVAQEDKSLTTKVAEAAQPVTQPIVNAAQTASNLANQATSAVGQQAANLGAAAADLKDQTVSAAHNLTAQAGLPVHVTPGQKPEAPHGVPPTNYNHGGIVSDQDKSIPQKVGEKLTDLKDQAVSQVSATAEQVGYQAGLTGHPVVAGQKPEAPHGVPPSSGNHEGLVAEQDKTVAQKVGEKVADVKAQTGL